MRRICMKWPFWCIYPWKTKLMSNDTFIFGGPSNGANSYYYFFCFGWVKMVWRMFVTHPEYNLVVCFFFPFGIYLLWFCDELIYYSSTLQLCFGMLEFKGYVLWMTNYIHFNTKFFFQGIRLYYRLSLTMIFSISIFIILEWVWT